ncbi:formylglycine-generating enzyme family protein [Paraburkholderia bannensis]|uniref:formylglycine-generating enzyme family protein n=1 Tax=Paraburkholderia bannensis TaxID=765414 RepID=UPI002AB0776C|nr:SUMF1/EgtB/PvdO family nonheme iron enzyme [Paraburkholderia bannensis]
MRLAHLIILQFATLIVAACAVAKNTSIVTPPKLPHISADLNEEQFAKQPVPRQPAALRNQLRDLGEGTIDARIEKLKIKVLRDLIFMEGGTFMMGDYGPLWSPDGVNYTSETDTKPVHKVSLSSYSISRYKTTNAEYDVYLDATGQSPEVKPTAPYRSVFNPADMKWDRAKNYCLWIGKLAGLPFDLPTEAQWEYAARSRGNFFIFGTDNGSLDFGRNVDDYHQVKPMNQAAGNINTAGGFWQPWNYPVGVFPPSPMGLYDVNADGFEWTNDWYAADYYKTSPGDDPKGPLTGTQKVARSTGLGEGPSGMNNVFRYSFDPDSKVNGPPGKPIISIANGVGVRCAVNLGHAVK